MESGSSEDFIVVGRFGKVYGVCGWIRVVSYTSPQTNIEQYDDWHFDVGGEWRALSIDRYRRMHQALVVRVEGIDDREKARQLTGKDIAVPAAALPELQEGDYYWRTLVGLQVLTVNGECLGEVNRLLATGANDVLVISPSESSVDSRERLIPWLPDRVIRSVDLNTGCIRVNWEPGY